MATLDDFIGTWVLDPAQNNYQTPNAPQAGTYTISIIEGCTLQFDMEWVDEQGNTKTAQYTSIFDGKQYPYENPDVADYVQSQLLDDTMQSDSYKSGRIISNGKRQLINDGTELLVTQRYVLADGLAFSNTSVYRRFANAAALH
jgi:hypothetical protein